jgi:hypothetical protein
MKDRCPIPKSLRHLRTFAGLPVPFTVKWNDDGPDFAELDPKLWLEAVEKKLCNVCGEKLGEWAFYIGGELCFNNRSFLDPPMHRNCAALAVKMCPFLNGKRNGEYRPEGIQHPLQSLDRPKKMLVMRGKTRALTFTTIDGLLTIHSGKIEIMEVIWQ